MLAVRRRSAFIAALSVAGLALAACSSSTAEPDAAPSTTEPVSTSASMSPSTSLPRAAPCTADTLLTATENRFPDAAVTDQVCSAQAALATITSSSLAGGDGVGMYIAGLEGEWLLAFTYPDQAALEAESPPQVPQALIRSWAGKVEDRRNPPPPPPPTTEAPPVTGSQGE